MRHIWKRLTGPRADRPRWRATVLAVATAVAPRRTRPMAVPEALDPRIIPQPPIDVWGALRPAIWQLSESEVE